MRYVTCLIAVVLIAPTCLATMIHVPSEQPAVQAGSGAATDGDTVQVHRLSGRLALSLHSGFLRTNEGLLIDDSSSPQNGLGIPLGVGLCYFIGGRVAGTIGFIYTPFPEWMYLWGAHETWSMLELGASLKYIHSSPSDIGVYWKLGLKMARLSGSRRPGGGLFGGSVGSSLKTKTAFAPGGELAFGLSGISSRNPTMFVEVAISHILMKEADVSVNGETAAWSYPFDLTMFGVRIGLLIPF